MQKPQQFIIPLAILSLLLGILTGWLRLGYNVPLSIAAGEHGLMMVGGFLGTLIALERAVVVKSRWALLVTLVQGLGVPALLLGEFTLAVWLFLAGTIGMAVIIYLFMIRFTDPFYYLLFGGSVCLAIGHVFLLRTHCYPTAVPWWMAFLLLTITAERLELSRFSLLTNKQRGFLWVALGVFMIGVMQPFHGIRQIRTGVGMVAMAVWLFRFDVARKLARRTDQHRYMGILLLLGYGWLLVSGLFLALPITFPFVYDAVLHTFFAGFAFSMIFTHGPVILPGVLGLHGRFYYPILYIGSLAQSVGLLVRVYGDLLVDFHLRLVGGVVQGVAIVFFMGCLLTVLIYRQKKSSVQTFQSVHD